MNKKNCTVKSVQKFLHDIQKIKTKLEFVTICLRLRHYMHDKHAHFEYFRCKSIQVNQTKI